jgi:hypothetical protein
MFVPTPVEPPTSPRVRELSERIQELIHEFQHRFPMTPAEIRQALRHAGATSGAGRHSVMPGVMRTILFWLAVVALPFVVTAIIRAGR